MALNDMQPDWDPAKYADFADLRLRPARDLLAGIGAVPAGDVVDLGCGNGAVAPFLRARFPAHRLIGVDTSPAMLAEAKGYDHLVLADIAAWRPEAPPALIWSNAALQWLGDHDTLFPRLANCLSPGGTLAVQMPRNYGAPSHRLMQDVAKRLFPALFAARPRPDPVASARNYFDLLAPFGTVSIHETEYFQVLDPVASGHPVRRFTESTGLRPYLARLDPDQRQIYLAAYDAALAEAYPLLPGGAALFPFRRLFILLKRSGPTG